VEFVKKDSTNGRLPTGGDHVVEFVGKTICITYGSGLEVQARYESAARMHWKCLAGPAAGQSGTETIQCRTIREGLYFVNWIEKSGTTVSNLLDFFENRVAAFVTYNAGSEREGTLDAGLFSIVP
jgi:phenolic acid decarboxylase